MSYKERALTAESNFHHTSRVVSGGNGGIINIKPSGESGGVFTHKSRVVDGDDSGIEYSKIAFVQIFIIIFSYYTKSSAPFSHKSRIVNGGGVEVEEAPRAPITPFFCHTSVAFENGKEHRQEPGQPYKNSYMR